MTATKQRKDVTAPTHQTIDISDSNNGVTAHANGPQARLLNPQAAAYLQGVEPYPLDVLGTQFDAMIGRTIEWELGNLLPR